MYRNHKYNILLFDENRMNYWLSGLIKIANFLNNDIVVNKIVVNGVYWTLNSVYKNNLHERYPEEKILEVNKRLLWMYEKIKEFIPNAKFINYTEKELEIDENHKWGMEPFHYAQKNQYKMLRDLFNLSFNNFKFNMPNIGNVDINFPVNWKINPFGFRSWSHHFMSLRWLNEKYTYLFMFKILMDFYNFHCRKKNKNPYYNSLMGDHTAAVRLNSFLRLKERFDSHEDPSIKFILNRLIIQELMNLQNNDIYRLGHNHALMLDISLLNLLKIFPEYLSKINIDMIISRSAETIKLMWHPSGLTREHSISYQEYNLLLIINYIKLLKTLNIMPPLDFSIDNILDESRKLLGFCLTEKGEYFPIGDSFRNPNINILNKIFGDSDGKETAHNLLFPYSNKDGCYSNNNFFIYRNNSNQRRIHFIVTCCWDSCNHKQNDELSFCLNINGETLFDDPGYTTFSEWSLIENLQSEYSHSTVNIVGKKWNDKKRTNYQSKILSGDMTDSGFFVNMQCSRVDGFIFVRNITLIENEILIEDKIISDKLSNEIISKRFILSPDINLKRVDDNKFQAILKNKLIAELEFSKEKDCKVTEDWQNYIPIDSANIGKTRVLIHEFRYIDNYFSSSLKVKLR